MGKLKKISVSLLFFILTIQGFSLGIDEGRNELMVTEELIFQIEIVDSIDINLKGTTIDFGDFIRNSKDTVRKTKYIEFNKPFEKDMLVNVDYPEGELSGTFRKFKMEHEKKNDKIKPVEDTIEVYLEKVEKYNLIKGETKIPIKGEIREVKEVALGRYSRNIKANVITTLKDPIKNIKGVGGKL